MKIYYINNQQGLLEAAKQVAKAAKRFNLKQRKQNEKIRLARCND